MALDFPNAPTIGQTFTAPDGTVWTWDGVKWVVGSSASGLIAAQQIDYDPLRLTAVGTKLKALGPLTSLNSVATPVSAALDGVLNQYIGGSNCTWNLPAGVSGMCLGIMLTNTTTSCTITPAGADALIGQAGTSYSNSFPMVIPPCLKGPYQILVLMFVSGNWASVSVASEISEAMGWVSRPYLEASYAGSTTFTPNVWLKAGLDVVDHDSHGWWSASNTRYIPQRKGVYRTCAQAILGDTTSKQCIQVMVSNALNGNLIRGHGNYWNGVNYLPSQNSVIVVDDISCNGTTDYIEPYVYCSANVPQFIGGTALNIEYLGP